MAEKNMLSKIYLHMKTDGTKRHRMPHPLAEISK